MRVEKQPKPAEQLPEEEKIQETVGEEREAEPKIKLINDKVRDYRDVAQKYAARAEILFQENQRRAKELGQKKWDKESAYYKQWYRTTKLVSLAEKIADFYDEHGDVETEYDKFDALTMDKSANAADKMLAVDKVFELKKLVEDLNTMKQELVNLYHSVKLYKKRSAEETPTEKIDLKKQLDEIEKAIEEYDSGWSRYLKRVNPKYYDLLDKRDRLREELGIKTGPTFAAKKGK